MSKNRRKKRVKRVFPARFSAAMVNTGHSVEPYLHGLLYKNKMKPGSYMFRPRDGSASVVREIPQRKGENAYNTPLAETLRKRWLAIVQSGETEYKRVDLTPELHHRKVWLYFAGSEAFLIREDFVSGVGKISATFPSRELAKQAFEINNIFWTTEYSLAESFPDLNPPPPKAPFINTPNLDWPMLQSRWVRHGAYCESCKRPELGPIVHDNIWKFISRYPKEILCEDCMNARMWAKSKPSRYLTKHDEKECVWNRLRDEYFESLFKPPIR
jgi:hypothetical protein